MLLSVLLAARSRKNLVHIGLERECGDRVIGKFIRRCPVQLAVFKHGNRPAFSVGFIVGHLCMVVAERVPRGSGFLALFSGQVLTGLAWDICLSSIQSLVPATSQLAEPGSCRLP